MSKGLNRADRLEEMRRLYHQRAYTDIELAERLGVDRTTVYKDRILLEEETPFLKDDEGRYRIDRTKFISSVLVNVREALSLYLPARRASQQTPSGQRDMAAALEKLALALRQPMTERLVKAADSVLSQKARPERDRVFEAVANAWVGQNRLHVRYRGLRAARPYNDVVDPYLVEPSPWSDSVYVIGSSQVFGDIVSYKLDRIETAHVSTEPFSLPDDFDEQALLRYAWGVWRGDGEPVVVKLRFVPGPAARRLQESTWHPLEEV
ncbi:MAG: WYL domain-containing protein, partial [Anaerolineae bacterium]|nr:WYL domain-containing protein [Anaerolineae bacterium]